jgi:hypothetical protein
MWGRIAQRKERDIEVSAQRLEMSKDRFRLKVLRSMLWQPWAMAGYLLPEASCQGAHLSW